MNDIKGPNINSIPIPIGFIYFQLPRQEGPNSIWPHWEWLDISEEYADRFFRVTSEKAEPFGEDQEEGAPRLDKVNITRIENGKDDYHEEDIISPGVWSKLLYTGSFSNGDTLNQHINFHVSGGEVRPMNTAIKIWKRIE